MKKILHNPAFTVVLFAFAAVLLLFGSVGGTRAVLNATSDIYESQMRTSQIGVSLLENDGSKNVLVASDEGNGAIMSLSSVDMVENAGDKEIKVGKEYSLPLYVSNSGEIPEYVRVTIYRYWVETEQTPGEFGWFNGSGTKRCDLDPTLIELKSTDGWVVDQAAPSESGERVVLYYPNVLQTGESVQFLDSVSISSDVLKDLSEVEIDGGRVIYTYSYGGLGFVLEVEVDAVQTHNATQAITGIWGHNIPG